MADAWTPVFVLPNLALAEPIECELAAIAPPHDRRVEDLKLAHPGFRHFLGRFSDNFGEKFEPAVLLVATVAATVYRNVSALGSFRDIAALSTITYNRARSINAGQRDGGHRVCFGDSFAIYPWSIDRDYRRLIGDSPAMLGLHDLSLFQGQSSPALPRTSFGLTEIDNFLFTALVDRWLRHHEAQPPEWEDVALMRSLNMAYHASLMPAGSEVTVYDAGRIISLWVSALEILAHPGAGGRTDKNKVFDLIDRTPWAMEDSGQLAYDTGGKSKRSLASFMAKTLYDRRNDFLHGNPVGKDALNVCATGRSLFDYAAPLYRIALTSFLRLTSDQPQPRIDDLDGLGRWIADRARFRQPQKMAEKALLSARGMDKPANA